MASIVLVPGAWLGAWAWDAVAEQLREAGHDVHPVTLTGLAERAGEATPAVNLDTHTDDLVALIKGRDLREVVLVAHSYGGFPATVAADRVPDRIARVVLPEAARHVARGAGRRPQGLSTTRTSAATSSGVRPSVATVSVATDS